MSFSSKTKSELNALEIKNPCCRKAFKEGLNISDGNGLEPDNSWRRCAQCTQAALRGVFIACGSVTNPERGYHLELSFNNERQMSRALEMLCDAGLPPKVSQRKGALILYYKDSGTIEDFFACIGATKAVFILMNSKIMRELRNNANRITNCETNNIDKTITASQKHISAIKRLTESGALALLPPELRETAELRMKHQQMSLSELGAMMDPPISKSGVSHRLEKLMVAAEGINKYAGSSRKK